MIRPPALLLILILAAHSAAHSAEIPFIDLAGETGRQVVVDREPGQYLGHPTTCLLDDGMTVLCVYPKGHGGGAIVYKRSRDGGKTWSERLPTPASWATSQEVPTLFRTTDAAGKKRILMFSGLYPIRMAVSEDEGETWGELAPIGEFGGIVAMGTMLELNTGPGHYLALFHDDGRFIAKDSKRAKPAVVTLFSTRSTDGGLTWHAPERIFASADIHLCEPGALRSPDGKQIAVLLRENARNKNSFVIFSGDEGKSWTAPRELPVTLTGDRHTAQYLPDGRLFISFRGRTSYYRPETLRNMPTEGDWAAWVGRYRDIVNNHPGEYVVRIADNTKGWDTAYPGVELLRDASILTTTYGHWQEGEPPYILSVRLKGSELDARAAAAPTVELSDDGMAAVDTLHAANASKIWDAAGHDASTDLIRFGDAFYCTFREGSSHVNRDDGKIRVLRSGDGDAWESSDLLEREGIDLRDPKLSATPDGRLMLSIGGADYDGEQLLGRQALVAFANPGERFGELIEASIDARIATANDWLWRVTWDGDETGYGVVSQPRDPTHNAAHLVATRNGTDYELVRTFDLPAKPSEATIRFAEDGHMIVVIRNDDGDQMGRLGVSAPPFTDWHWKVMEHRLGGPNFIALPDATWWLSTRRYTGPPRTIVGLLDPDLAAFEPQIRLPSGGDTGYPGMLVHDGKLWISYDSTHEGESNKTAIYLSTLQLPEKE